ncbi:hypothetical protein DL766_000152 [Monosporascus sp. MC13-8B]|uniref:Uncharacterized protein n=1 Tax=Monosporascus cannonballus TaxID=155416 RepID=A0ABY0H7C5_9PEZI|nr:hypothetical protein DL762_004581 [Monosporascus cannonballus]RYO92224.1 hypothetical protein DL763_004754 [Monosporascus cannonballus]RYP39943.1 hypothetical protein DL766_000152 [Monosporascus sp. MC13-8B]
MPLGPFFPSRPVLWAPVNTPELFFHIDGSRGALPPRTLARARKTRADSGGHSLLVDGRRLMRRPGAQEPPPLHGPATSGGYPSFRAGDGSSSSSSLSGHAPVFDPDEAAPTTAASGSQLAALSSWR